MFGHTSKTDDIYVVDNSIDYANQEALLGFCRNSLYSFGHSAQAHSPHDLSRFVSQLTAAELAVTKLDTVFAALTQQYFKRSVSIDRSYINAYFAYTPTAIHTDDYDPAAITFMIYANTQWHADWAGETQFFNQSLDEVTRSILPRGGRSVLFPGNLPHTARAPSVLCPGPRFTLTIKGFLT